MTEVVVAFVDVCVLRKMDGEWRVLLLRRAAGGRSPGSWEGVHGRIDPGESPDQTARREFGEETGLKSDAWYNLSRVESFYQVEGDRVVLIPVFVVVVTEGIEPRISAEHDAWEWLSPEAAAERCTWPRFARSIADAMRLLSSGDAGVAMDALGI